MRHEPGTGSRRRARVSATLAAGVLALTGAVAIGVGVAGQEPAPPPAPQAAQPTAGDGASPTGDDSSPEPAQSPSSAEASPQGSQQKDKQKAEPSGPSGKQALGLDYSEPVSLRIPAIGATSSSLEDLGLNSEGAMTTPDDPDKAGWFTPSPPPGVPGTSVIAGHVTWNEDRSVFFSLGELRKGDRVEVTRADGVTAIFEVTKIGSFPKDEFPTEAVYQSTDYPALRLITCGGDYDEETNNYLSNVIVWARMVDSVKA
ncbi:MAG TPA: class F sortase [Nocardioidaceae bacterium]|nr:class F sortase [Nocardioidaceae bacterium]